MKKALLIFAMGALLSMSANAQWFDFKNNVHRYEIGVNIGMAGIGTEFHDLGFGASVSAWGVYLDVLSAGPKYQYNNHVEGFSRGNALVPDSTATTVNIGYQIPVLPWLRVMPLIGFCRNTSGYTDFSTVNIDINGSDNSTTGQIYHDYIKEHGHGSFNFGGGLVISPVKWVSVYGVYTPRAIYGGVSLNLSTLAEMAGE